ncbi:MAG: Hsp20/alpha crystallin family protein [Streptosporangiaceae bacterium]
MSTRTATSSQDLADWAGSPLSTVHHLAAQAKPIPVEQYPDGSCYVFRLEVPGVDPAQDLAVSVEAGTLSVRAERRNLGPAGTQSEFRYGTFARHIVLPPGSDPQDVSASYHNGIVTVRIGIKAEHQQAPRRIDVSIEP